MIVGRLDFPNLPNYDEPMSRTKDESNAHDISDRILDAATDLFARKGFDATGIDEISRTAGVTKSLIYYYFKNKGAILEGIFSRFQAKAEAVDAAYRRGVDPFASDPGSGDLAPFIDTHLSPITMDAKPILRIAFSEAMKDDPPAAVFDFFETNMNYVRRALASRGFAAAEAAEFPSFSFFMLVMPAVGVSLLGDAWCARHGISKDAASSLVSRHTAFLVENFFKD